MTKCDKGDFDMATKAADQLVSVLMDWQVNRYHS